MRLSAWVVLAGCVIGLGAGGAWMYALQRQDLPLTLYERAAEARLGEAASPIDAEAFRARICPGAGCVEVEAAGLSFRFGSGPAGALAPDSAGRLPDAVFVTDLSAETLLGLGPLRRATWLAGRRTPLPVYGPPGIGLAVEGVNAAAALSDRSDLRRFRDLHLDASLAPLMATDLAGADPQGEVAFDSGVVAVRTWPAGPAEERLYRVEWGEAAIVVAGCNASAEDLARAAKGFAQVGLILPAAAPDLIAIDRDAASRAGRPREAALASAELGECLSAEEAMSIVQREGFTDALVLPFAPRAADAASRRAWEHETGRSGVRLGWPGEAIDMHAAARRG